MPPKHTKKTPAKHLNEYNLRKIWIPYFFENKNITYMPQKLLKFKIHLKKHLLIQTKQ